MKSSDKPFSLKLIYWISSLAVALFALGLILSIVLELLVFFDVSSGKPMLSIELPIEVSYAHGTMELMDQAYPIIFRSQKGTITIDHPPKMMFNIIFVFISLFLTIGLFVAWAFRKFIKNVRDGHAFSPGNIKYLKHMSYRLIISWGVILVLEAFLFNWASGSISINEMQISRHFDFHLNFLFGALFLWMLSHVFMKGLELKQETELTV